MEACMYIPGNKDLPLYIGKIIHIREHPYWIIAITQIAHVNNCTGWLMDFVFENNLQERKGLLVEMEVEPVMLKLIEESTADKNLVGRANKC